MAIVNRDSDVSEQRDVLSAQLKGYLDGTTVSICVFPRPGKVEAVRLACAGISGAPVLQLSIQRFIVGGAAGGTNLGTASFTAITAQVMGTSGVQTIAVASGTTFLNQVQEGDQLIGVCSPANTAITSGVLSLVVRNLQDIKSSFSV